MSPAVRLISLAVAFSGVCWLFPLFHVVTLKKAIEEKVAATFNPTKFAETFWDDKLLKSLDGAVKAEELLPAIQRDPSAARKKYGQSLGLGDNYIYFVSGTGRVVATTDDEASLVVTVGGKQPEISLQVGLIFGNAVRDGTGLLNVNDYPNSQDFNAISEELNRIVEARVLPKLRKEAKVGVLLHFAGCAEVDDEGTDLKPLKVIPVQAEIQ
jgi:predicted lipoprotein